MSILSRRQFIHTSIVAAGAASLAPSLWAQGVGKGRKIPIALQLYSVRGDCAKDTDAALAQVAKMGFEGVEFAGYHKYAGKAAELRQKLDDLGLKVAATHIATSNFRGDALKNTIEFHQVIGCKYLIAPGDPDFTDPEKSKALAELFVRTAAELKPLGMACGYHNHTREFAKEGDTTFWDLFAQRTNRDVVLQQDCGWSAAAGYNPVDLIRKYPGRTQSTHFKPAVLGDDKDKGKKAYIGEDSVDWGAVYVACRDIGDTQWVTIEQETYPDGKSPMECSEISLKGLKKILAS